MGKSRYATLECRQLRYIYLVDDDHKRAEIIRIPYGARDLEKFFEEELP